MRALRAAFSVYILSFSLAVYVPRQSVERCGPSNGGATCVNDECCSNTGWCGTTVDHCKSPDCLIDFGRCDSSVTPAGPDTEPIPRPHVGTVPYGQDIYHCANPGDIALTFDDGPFTYTAGMLDLLKKYDARATFFITGINNGKGAIDDPSKPWADAIKRMKAEGHQIASHTWSHQDLSKITKAQRRDETIKLEMALRNIVGVIPTYMRPPYSSCSAECMADMSTWGYHVTYFDLDTDDYNRVTPEAIQGSKDIFFGRVSGANANTADFLTIAHDIHQQTAQNLTEFMLQTLQANNFKAVPVGQCLGDPEANWYRDAGGVLTTRAPTTSAPPTNSTSMSTPGPSSVTNSTAAPTSTALPTTLWRNTTITSTSIPGTTTLSTSSTVPTSNTTRATTRPTTGYGTARLSSKTIAGPSTVTKTSIRQFCSYATQVITKTQIARTRFPRPKSRNGYY